MIRRNKVIVVEAFFIILLIISNYFSLFKNQEYFLKLSELKDFLFSVLNILYNFIEEKYVWFSNQNFDTSFNNREIALSILITIAVIFSLMKKNIRKSILSLLKSVLGKHFIKVYIEISLYMCFICFFLYEIKFWSFSYTKDTILWAIFSGLLLSYKSVDKKEEDGLFLNLIVESLGITLIYEFLMNTFTYPVWGELLLLSFLIFIGLMIGTIEIDKDNEKYRLLYKILDNINVFVGLIILLHLIIEVIVNHKTFFTIDTLKDFLLPIILTITFIPYMYYLTISVFYEEIFMRIRFNKKLNSRQRIYFKLRVVLRCGMSRMKIRNLLNNIRLKLISVESIEDINGIFRK